MCGEGKAGFLEILPDNTDPNNMNCEDRLNELGLFGLKRNEMGERGREGKNSITFRNQKKCFRAYKTTLFSMSVIINSLNCRTVNLSA